MINQTISLAKGKRPLLDFQVTKRQMFHNFIFSKFRFDCSPYITDQRQHVMTP